LAQVKWSENIINGSGGENDEIRSMDLGNETDLTFSRQNSRERPQMEQVYDDYCCNNGTLTAKLVHRLKELVCSHLTRLDTARFIQFLHPKSKN
jgi:hypothetical protein